MEGQLDLDKAMIAIGDMGLASVNVGDYLIILNKDIDLTVGDEPYISFILFYNKVSGRFFKRIWNKTVATGTTTDIATLVKVCGVYFNRGMTCLCFMKSDGQYELPQDVTSACHSFMTKIHGNDGKMCSECRKILETINDGVQEKEDIKSEDFEDKINEESSFEDGLHGQPPTETVFDYDSVANEVDVKEEEGVHNGGKEPLSQVERPNISYQDLIVEALEGGKTLSVKEIMEFISQKHTNIVLSVDRVRRCLTGTNLFERLSPTGDKMRGHWRLNTSKEGSKSDKCDFCDRRFPEGKKGNKFLWHMKAWHGKNSFHCPSCEFHANFAAEVFEHIELVKHQDETIECPMCHEFFNEADMTSHYRPCFAKTSRARIKEGNRISKPCPTCGKVINTKRGYKQHLMMHLRQEGEQSSVAVPYSNGEKKNLWIYCDKCDKKFASIWMLNKHTQGEHGTGFNCDQCSMTLKSIWALKRHQRLEHSTDPKYACKFCGKRCLNTHEVKLHERWHQEPQFQCSTCAKTFKTEENLVAHERYHTGERPFKCSVCGAGFTCNSRLWQHKKGVHKIAPRGGKTGWSKSRKTNVSAAEIE